MPPLDFSYATMVFIEHVSFSLAIYIYIYILKSQSSLPPSMHVDHSSVPENPLFVQHNSAEWFHLVLHANTGGASNHLRKIYPSTPLCVLPVHLLWFWQRRRNKFTAAFLHGWPKLLRNRGMIHAITVIKKNFLGSLNLLLLPGLGTWIKVVVVLLL